MEIDILNELLNDSVSKLFNPRSSLRQQQVISQNQRHQIPSGSVSTTITNVSNSSAQASGHANPTIDQWINLIGPQKLQESLQKFQLILIRLGIDLQRLTKKDLEAMGYDQLNEEKKRVKNELKKYDAVFQGIFNRFPLRNEKEPMRPLYIYYKKLKLQLDKMAPGQNAVNSQTEIARKVDELKRTRAELREKLNAFQNEFTQTHNRRIRFHRDIAPVEREYRMYKEIKAQIQRLEEMMRQ